MNIKIHAIGFDVTPAIEDYIIKKVSTLEKFLGNDMGSMCTVHIGKNTRHHKSGDIFYTEINLTRGGDQYFAKASQSELYAAIDVVRDEMERVVVSGRKRKESLVRRGEKKIKDLLRRLKS